MLSVNLLLGQTFHYHPNGLVRAQRYDAEPLRLSIRPILEELHVLEVGNANVCDVVSNVLIRRPLQKVLPKTKPRYKLGNLAISCIHTWWRQPRLVRMRFRLRTYLIARIKKNRRNISTKLSVIIMSLTTVKLCRVNKQAKSYRH